MTDSSLRPAYVLLAHKNPDQVARLAGRLRDGNGSVFIHVDGKYGEQPFREAVRRRRVSDVRFIRDRTRVQWGGFSTVVAMLRAMGEAAEADGDFSHVLLMSGQCYPIKPLGEIEAFLGERRGMEIISALRIPDQWAEPQKRYRRYYLNEHRNVLAAAGLRLANRLLPERHFPRGYSAHGGSMYFCLTPECVFHVRNEARRLTSYNRFFKLTNIPDELYFQTLIMNSPFAANVVNWSPWHIRFAPTSANPDLLGAGDLQELAASSKLFARKFDTDHDRSVLDQIDEMLAR